MLCDAVSPTQSRKGENHILTSSTSKGSLIPQRHNVSTDKTRRRKVSLVWRQQISGPWQPHSFHQLSLYVKQRESSLFMFLLRWWRAHTHRPHGPGEYQLYVFIIMVLQTVICKQKVKKKKNYWCLTLTNLASSVIFGQQGKKIKFRHLLYYIAHVLLLLQIQEYFAQLGKAIHCITTYYTT